MARNIPPYNHVKIANDCLDLGATQSQAYRVLVELETFSSQDPVFLKEKAVSVLDKYNPEVAKKLASLNMIKVYTSDYKISNFTKQKIIDSLMKESNLSRGLSTQIAIEVEKKLHELKKQNVSSNIIRQIVSVKLIEYDLVDAYEKYSRIGLPVYDLAKLSYKKSSNSSVSDSIFKAYNINTFDSAIKEEFFSGNIYISALESFYTKFYHSSLKIPKMSADLKNKSSLSQQEVILMLIDTINSYVKDTYTFPSLDKFNYNIAEYYSKITIKDDFCNNLLLLADRALKSNAQGKLTIDLSCGVRKTQMFSYARYHEIAKELFNNFLIAYSSLQKENLLDNIEIKISVSSFDDFNMIPEEIKKIIYSSKIIVQVSSSYGTSSNDNMFLHDCEYDNILSHVSINFPNLIDSSLSKEKFLQTLSKELTIVKRLSSNIDANFPQIPSDSISLHSIGIYGLEDAVISLTESNIYEPDSVSLLSDIKSVFQKKMSPMSKYVLSSVNDICAIEKFKEHGRLSSKLNKSYTNGVSEYLLDSNPEINSFFLAGYLIEADSINSFENLLRKKCLQIRLSKND